MPIERRKRKLVELIRNYSFSYHHHLNNPSVETEDKFQKDKDAMAKVTKGEYKKPVAPVAAVADEGDKAQAAV